MTFSDHLGDFEVQVFLNVLKKYLERFDGSVSDKVTAINAALVKMCFGYYQVFMRFDVSF